MKNIIGETLVALIIITLPIWGSWAYYAYTGHMVR